MFFKRPAHRVFDYTPRFYDPQKDEREKRKRKLGFAQQRRNLKKRRSPLIWAIFIIFVIFIYLKLTGGW